MFRLESIMSSINITTHALFRFSLVWSIFSHPFTLSLCVTLKLKQFSCKQNMFGSWFYPCSHSISFDWNIQPIFIRIIIRELLGNYREGLTNVILIIFWLFLVVLYLPYNLSWRMFHMCLRRIYILLLLEGMLCICLLGPFSLKYVQHSIGDFLNG